MTYDDAVNKIVECYRNGEFPGWTMTDSDSAQMRRVKDGRYEFVEMLYVNGTKNTVAFYHEFIDLDDYTEGELWFYGSLYYADKEEFEGFGADIAAECVYEQTRSIDALGSPDKMLELYLKNVKEG